MSRTVYDTARDKLEAFAEKEGMNLTKLREDCGIYTAVLPEDDIYVSFITRVVHMFSNLLDNKGVARVLDIPVNRVIHCRNYGL